MSYFEGGYDGLRVVDIFDLFTKQLEKIVKGIDVGYVCWDLCGSDFTKVGGVFDDSLLQQAEKMLLELLAPLMEEDSAYDVFIKALDKELDDAVRDELEYQDDLDSRADDAAILGYAMEAVFSRLPIDVQRKLVRNLNDVSYSDMINILSKEDFNRYMDRYF